MFKKTLTCVLADDEIQKLGEDVAAKIGEKDEAEDSMKSSAAHWKDKITAIQAEIRIMVRKITTHKEDRLVECDWEYLYDAGVKKLWRLDTHEVIATEKIPQDEMQEHLKLEGEAPKEIEATVEVPGEIGRG